MNILFDNNLLKVDCEVILNKIYHYLLIPDGELLIL